MSKVLLMGECMVELRPGENNTLHQSFAGDVYNSAVYMKRMFPAADVGLVSAIGVDSFSDQMLSAFDSEAVNHDFVFRSQEKIPGMYAIQTDAQGERSFTYWRNDSAARQVMQFINAEQIQKLSESDVFFFSGISLAVIAPEQRSAFWKMLDALREKGVRIAFDPNYRARMWQGELEAKTEFEQAFTRSDIVLPGIEDFVELYGFSEFEQVIEFLMSFNVDEIVVKNGPDGVQTAVGGQRESFSIEAVKNVVDTTSAGDSFNGTYLGARLNQASVADAVLLASKAAAFVIQHRGAIVPRTEYQTFIESV